MASDFHGERLRGRRETCQATQASAKYFLSACQNVKESAYSFQLLPPLNNLVCAVVARCNIKLY